jgi:GxxExxY protein
MSPEEPNALRDPETHSIIGAAMEVHTHLGHGFLEAVYQEALSAEFTLRRVRYRREVELPVIYKGERLKCAYRADFVCFESVIVELKALAAIGPIEQAQTLNYLKATRLGRALLINFGAPRLEFKRFVWQNLRLARNTEDHESSAPSADQIGEGI